MRYVPILLLASLVLADEKKALEAFKEARADSVARIDVARLEDALDRLAKEGGPVSLGVVSKFIHETYVECAELKERIAQSKERGAKAYADVDRASREIEHLQHRQKAGATGLGPEIEAREAGIKESMRAFERAKAETNGMAKRFDQLVVLRQRAAEASTKLLARAPADRFEEASRELRASLDATSPDQSLLLVRILRQSDRPECATSLLEIYSQPKTPEVTRIEAACAIASLGERQATATLLDRFDAKDESATKRLLHTLSRMARRKLDTLDAAKSWVKEPAE